jgi:alpha-tubulin suppressor-like RCC1 family protein
VRAVAAGQDHFAAVAASGELYCWGRVARGNVVRRPRAVAASLVGGALCPFGAGLPAWKVACGMEHTAVLTRDGRLFTRGSNSQGQLGQGLYGSQSAGELVAHEVVERQPNGSGLRPGFLAGRRAVGVSCGNEHTVVTLAGGQVVTCGAGWFGRLGQGTGGGYDHGAGRTVLTVVPGGVRADVAGSTTAELDAAAAAHLQAQLAY